jgi:hypothetical protein
MLPNFLSKGTRRGKQGIQERLKNVCLEPENLHKNREMDVIKVFKTAKI